MVDKEQLNCFCGNDSFKIKSETSIIACIRCNQELSWITWWSECTNCKYIEPLISNKKEKFINEEFKHFRLDLRDQESGK
ncbi:MAG: hypothetical protein HeimC3_44410 [Candidatus Heimdallarchaeota archaeon LC_3]|nr:MAG: hypothetical protein HeimC3_44410 [Candidatus Heimdallarchaeota archaeon LC_3]